MVEEAHWERVAERPGARDVNLDDCALDLRAGAGGVLDEDERWGGALAARVRPPPRAAHRLVIWHRCGGKSTGALGGRLALPLRRRRLYGSPLAVWSDGLKLGGFEGGSSRS